MPGQLGGDTHQHKYKWKNRFGKEERMQLLFCMSLKTYPGGNAKQVYMGLKKKKVCTKCIIELESTV